MDRQIINKRIAGIKSDVEKLARTLTALENTDLAEYPENYEMLSIDAAFRAELITCRLRQLIYITTNVKKSEYLSSAVIVQGIEINVGDGILEVNLPCLLPKKKQRRSTDFLIDPLYFTLSSYAANHKLPRFEHCVACFSNIYNKELPLRRVRDYDNLELKQILDVMVDDTGLLCDAYNTTELGDADCTRITIMEKEYFPKWLKERKSAIQDISDF